jgi:hypothetical protein
MKTAMAESPDGVARVLVAAHAIDDVPLTRVRELVARHRVVILRGLFDPASIAESLACMRSGFDPGRDCKHDPRDTDAIRRNFQKLQVGANSGTGTRRTLGRFMRVLYNPTWEPDIYRMRGHFVRLAQLRNRLYGLPSGFAIDRDEQGMWTCARLQQYPRGGGFMVPHRDMYAQAATIEAGLGYFQLLLLLTQKGRDFEHGGAYVDSGDEVDGRRFEYEAGCLSGDVVIYDGRSIHGVADIDPMQPLELDRFGGRVVAMASLFRTLAPGDSDYGELARSAVRTLSPRDGS